MSKLVERVPAMTDQEAKLALVNDVVPAVAGDDGRINIADLVNEIETKVAQLDVNEERLIQEGRRSAAEQIASAWANLHTITLDRNQKAVIFQMQPGTDRVDAFAKSYFKIGSEFVPPAAMSVDDFETMLERQARRIVNAQADNAIWQELYNQARPGLEAGQNLVQQFESGTLELGSGEEPPAVEA